MSCAEQRRLRQEFFALDPRQRAEFLHNLCKEKSEKVLP